MIKYNVKHTAQFKKDYKLAIKQSKEIRLLNEVITTLATGNVLHDKYKDHELKGNWKGYRECHIQSDWLLPSFRW